MNKSLKVIANVNLFIGIVMLATPILFLVYYIFFSTPQIVQAKYDANKENEIIAKPIYNNESKKFKDPFGKLLIEDTYEKYLDFTVPENSVIDIGTRIRIPMIGLDTTVFETKSPTLGLGSGVWRDPLYGVPDRKKTGPVILAAHRWGEDWFSWQYRYQNLFTKFDQLKLNEEVILTWNGTEYRYRIESIEENTAVTKSADLILYTCVYYNSPERIFVYANLSD